VLEFDLNSRQFSLVKTVGVTVRVRRFHATVCFKGSMVVFGGTSEIGLLYQEMFSYNFDESEWAKVRSGG
jgi:hypothetical protein